MAWMYDLPPGLRYFSGTAEVLAGLGLILPGLTRIQTRLTPLAAVGLVLVMMGAAVWHSSGMNFNPKYRHESDLRWSGGFRGIRSVATEPAEGQGQFVGETARRSSSIVELGLLSL